MEVTFSDQEELLLKSWDAPVSAGEGARLAELIQRDHTLRKQSDQYQKIREMLQSHEPNSFGPFFAERIINAIKQRTANIDYQVFFFFKKYQVLILGVLVALLIANSLFSEQLTLRSIFGLDKETTPDVFSIDLYKNVPQ